MFDTSAVVGLFPNIKLCYEKITHNKVSRNCMLIPYGTKCFIWFITYNKSNVCFVLELTNKKITKVYPISLHYNSSLCKGHGTILYGTIFMNYTYKLKMITIENIFYRNTFIDKPFDEKWEIICQLLREQKIRSNKIMIGLPIIMNPMNIGKTKEYNDDYKVQYVQYNNETIVKIPFKHYEKREINEGRTFLAQYNGQTEIYNLLDDNNHFVDIALIPSYKTSVMMKQAFTHKVRGMDEYEDSDDEEVEYKKEIRVYCIFDSKFQKWVPLHPV